ncbi:guanine nucleotide exchange protein for ADP-robosylation factor [Kappamyces sp. JEL0680]|nr:guanine nucleotide exchange protein for ADP-robosylation factor [Kappamyces sp. JEL0680]
MPLSKEQVKDLFSVDGDAGELRKQGIALMATGVLKPLFDWCSPRAAKPETVRRSDDKASDEDNSKSLGLIAEDDPARHTLIDDPTAIGYLKQRKQNVIEGIKRFNAKPKKGIQFLLETKCIESRTPREIAKFLLETDGLNKSMIGDFLGEGEEENIAIMHAFVEEFAFVDQGFVDSLRSFLQSFRLPGEAQKIDRFMLKFAEIYLKGNPDTFSSADTAYVLAYSVIMLNTDQHNAQVKRKMTKQDFLKNNRGIDGGKDIPEAFLGGIFDEIANNEIIMKDEAPTKAALQAAKEPSNTKKTLSATSESMALKTEKMMRKGTTKKTVSDDRASAFIFASHYAHVKPMFELIWMSVLTGLSTPLQEGEDAETIMTCLEGVKNAIRITCIFELELERNALLSTLSKFTLLNNIQEMREKNFEAIRTLLDIAYQEGGNLGSSWKDVVSCISQLEKLQLVGEGVDSTSAAKNDLRKRDASSNRNQQGKPTFLEEAAAVASSQMMTLSVDKIFTSSSRLSGTAIVHFVRALCEVSWDEISTSVDKEQPRMYCLQRLVEISYYNMKRIRVEWSNIWAILGQHFNQVGCYPNTNVALFALDKLRQLAMKFLELEELPNFKFQKDFLRPFEEIIKNNADPKIKDMCLVCIQQVIQVKGNSLKSGWKTLCGTLMRVAREVNEPLVLLGFDIVKSIMKASFDSILSNGSLSDFIACIVEFCKNKKSSKINQLALDLLRQCTQKINDTTVSKLTSQNSIPKGMSVLSPLATPSMDSHIPPVHTRSASMLQTDSLHRRTGTMTVSVEEDICIRYWMPLLFGLHDIIMSCDLEVRTKALTFLFETLKGHGSLFSTSFWEILAKGVLFPIFDDMKQSSSNTNALNSKFANKEELAVWLSTTLIAAIRQFVDLFTHFYQTIGFMLPSMLDLLRTCLVHENEALSRIGSTCLQQLVDQNTKRLSVAEWRLVVKTFTDLFSDTAPSFLFFNYADGAVLELTLDPSLEARFAFLGRPLGPSPDRKDFQRQLSKCVTHLMVVQTLQDVLASGHDDSVYKSIPNEEFLMLLDCFKSSYHLAHTFNESMELRTALYKLGYMKQLPNLLKQETMSVNAYLVFLIKLASDPLPHRQDLRSPTLERLIPLCLDIINQYNSFEAENAKQRSISAWRPVVVVILTAFAKFDDEHFKLHIQKFYPPAIRLLLQEMTPDVRVAIYNILVRAGNLFGLGQTGGVMEELPSHPGPAAASEDPAAGESTQ